MARRTPSQLNMLLAVDKPVGCTSHDVVSQCRRALHERRVGHAGTLDPMSWWWVLARLLVCWAC